MLPRMPSRLAREPGFGFRRHPVGGDRGKRPLAERRVNPFTALQIDGDLRSELLGVGLACERLAAVLLLDVPIPDGPLAARRLDAATPSGLAVSLEQTETSQVPVTPHVRAGLVLDLRPDGVPQLVEHIIGRILEPFFADRRVDVEHVVTDLRSPAFFAIVSTAVLALSASLLFGLRHIVSTACVTNTPSGRLRDVPVPLFRRSGPSTWSAYACRHLCTITIASPPMSSHAIVANLRHRCHG